MLGTKESVSLLSQLKKIVMLGRQAGYFLIVAASVQTQSILATVSEITSISVWGWGRISELGYGMLFGSDVKKQFSRSVSRGVAIVMWEQA